jgi:hypothetical protein
MAFLYDKFEICTDLEPSSVHNKILSVVETQKFWASPYSTTKPYFGEVRDSHFGARRIKWNRRTIIPVIVGEIYSSKKGSRVNVQVRLNWFEFIFYMLVLGIIGYFVIWYFSETYFAAWVSNRILEQLVPLLSFLFVYLLLYIPVKFEAVATKRFFLKLLDGKSEVDAEKNKLG